jgi:ABC-type multidrug transport system ATPase subunit
MAHIHSWPDADLTLILVSHDLDELVRLVERAVLLDKGRIVADGPVRQILSDAELLRAARFDVPLTVALLRALQDAGWGVRADRLLPEEAAAEIARVAAVRQKGGQGGKS